MPDLLYAIVQTGGKQYSVRPGDTIEVERLDAPVGGEIELTEVLALVREGKVEIGSPTVAGAKVVAEVAAQDRDAKTVVFKFKRKTRYQRMLGHRQPFARLVIKEIVFGSAGEGEAKEAKEEPEAEVVSHGAQKGRRKQPQRSR